jgi:DNA-binding CsgD family transcriptional regulator
MGHGKRYEQLVGELYDAALSPQRWTKSLNGVCEWLGGDSFHFFGWDVRASAPIFSMVGHDHLNDVQDQYGAYYGAIDPRMELVAKARPGELTICHHHFDRRYVDRSEFYQDFFIPNGLRYVFGSTLVRQDGIDATIGFVRINGRKPYNSEEILRLTKLMPHLQRSVRIYLETEDLRQRALIGERGLDALEIGVLATDEAGRMVFANRRADALLREGDTLKLRHGLLVATLAEEASRLDAALRRTVSSGHAESVRLMGGGEDPHAKSCFVTVLPLAEQNPLVGIFGRPKLLLLVSQGAHQRVLTGKQLMQLFALSPAEARLARALVQGQTAEQYAMENALSMATVRTQLRAVFAKTATRRQSDLVRLLSGIPSVRGPTSPQS